MLNEIWNKIDGYDNYQVSNFGRVKSLNFRRTKKSAILKNTNQSVGYLVVSLGKDGKLNHFLVHRLVASSFLKNNQNLKEVNHKNGNKKDNNLQNLEWISSSNNKNHAHKPGLISKTSNKLVINIENGIFYKSISEAAKTINTSIYYLGMMLNGKCKNKTNIRFA